MLAKRRAVDLGGLEPRPGSWVIPTDEEAMIAREAICLVVSSSCDAVPNDSPGDTSQGAD